MGNKASTVPQPTDEPQFTKLIVFGLIRELFPSKFNTFPLEIILMIYSFYSSYCKLVILPISNLNNYKQFIETLSSSSIQNGYKSISSNAFGICIQSYDNTLYRIYSNKWNKWTFTECPKIKNDFIRVISTNKESVPTVMPTKKENTLLPGCAFVITKSGNLYQAGSCNYFKSIIRSRQQKFNKVLSNTNIMKTIKKICCGSNHSLFLTFNGNVYVIGDNKYGQCGLPIFKKKVRALHLLESFGCNIDIIDIAVSTDSSLCLSKKGKLFGFGLNNRYELGLLHNNKVYKPTISQYFVDKNLKIIHIDIFNGYTGIISHKKSLYTFGRNTYGAVGNSQNGNGNTITVNEPYLVYGFKVEYVCCSNEKVLFLTISNELYGMGKWPIYQYFSNYEIRDIPTLITRQEMGLSKDSTIETVITSRYLDILVVVREYGENPN